MMQHHQVVVGFHGHRRLSVDVVKYFIRFDHGAVLKNHRAANRTVFSSLLSFMDSDLPVEQFFLLVYSAY